MLSGFGLSALIFNNIAFVLVNPNNETPVNGVYPENVNEKVPYMIRVLAAIYFGMAMVAVIFVFAGPKPEEPNKCDAFEQKNTDGPQLR